MVSIIYYFEQKDLFVRDGKAFGCVGMYLMMKNVGMNLEMSNDSLSEFNVILMRKDPPFDLEYIYTTYILRMADIKGC